MCLVCRFESAPFKLTSEYMQLLGPEDGEVFRRFRETMVRGHNHSTQAGEGTAVAVEGLHLRTDGIWCVSKLMALLYVWCVGAWVPGVEQGPSPSAIAGPITGLHLRRAR
jgi:hypothetical protein